MSSAIEPAIIVSAWNTAHRVTTFLIENLPSDVWSATIPGTTRRSIRSVACHIHNARCMWVRQLGREHGIEPPAKVEPAKTDRRQLVAALNRSGRAVTELLQFGCDRNGRIPPSRAYAWRNLQLDVGHVLAYLVAHEGHHRGQIVLAARQLGHPLPASVIGGLWQWRKRATERR